jgi:hypothetical protein
VGDVEMLVVVVERLMLMVLRLDGHPAPPP